MGQLRGPRASKSQKIQFQPVKSMPTITDVYEVQPGDSLSKIANKFGLSLNDLLQANQQILNPNLIKIGQKINRRRTLRIRENSQS